MKHGFELHGFFLVPKTAYLEALLYMDWALTKYFSFEYAFDQKIN